MLNCESQTVYLTFDLDLWARLFVMWRWPKCDKLGYWVPPPPAPVHQSACQLSQLGGDGPSCQARAAEDTVFLTSICQVLVAAHHCLMDSLHSHVHLLPCLHGHQQDADGSSGQPDVNLMSTSSRRRVTSGSSRWKWGPMQSLWQQKLSWRRWIPSWWTCARCSRSCTPGTCPMTSLSIS